MARSKLNGTARDAQGNIIASATVAVFLAGTSTVASVYTAASGGTAVNSVTSGTNGTFVFWVDPGDYTANQQFDLTIAKDGYTTTTFSGINVFINPFFIFFSTGSGTVASGDTKYIGVGNVDATEANVNLEVPFACTAQSLYAIAGVAASGTRVYTLMKNGATTTITASSTGATTTASDTAHSVQFAAGDEVSVKIVASGGADTTTHMVTIGFCGV